MPIVAAADAVLEGRVTPAQAVVLLLSRDPKGGFHPDNMRRFQFFSPETTKQRMLIAALSGLGTVEREQLQQRLEDKDFAKGSIMLNANSCNDFFSYVASLE